MLGPGREGAQPQQLPQCHKHPCGAVMPQRDRGIRTHSGAAPWTAQDSPDVPQMFPSAPQFGDITQAGWSKVRLHSQVGRVSRTPKLIPNPHPTTAALNKASVPQTKPSPQILPSPDAPDTKSRSKGGMETTTSSRSLPTTPPCEGTENFPAFLKAVTPEVFLK